MGGIAPFSMFTLSSYQCMCVCGGMGGYELNGIKLSKEEIANVTVYIVDRYTR